MFLSMNSIWKLNVIAVCWSAFITSGVLSVSNIPPAAILGCFQGSNSNLVGATIFWNSGMTQAVCSSYCVTLGYRYAGVASGSSCSCTNGAYNLNGKCTDSTACTVLSCNGDSTQSCGTSACYIIIDTVLAGSDGSIFLPSAAYVGCYQDDYNNKNLNGLPVMIDQGSMTQKFCASYCSSKGFRYAGVFSSASCSCTNGIYNNYGPCTITTGCNQACSGDSRQMCGNYDCDLVIDTSLVTIDQAVASPEPACPSTVCLTWVDSYTPVTAANTSSVADHGISCARMCLADPLCQAFVLQRNSGSSSENSGAICQLYETTQDGMPSLKLDSNHTTYLI